jgi:hypothetical protein
VGEIPSAADGDSDCCDAGQLGFKKPRLICFNSRIGF